MDIDDIILKKKEYQKNYKIKRNDYIKNYLKEYREKNKQKLKEKASQIFTCECGKKVLKCSKARHIKSKIHTKSIDLKNAILNNTFELFQQKYEPFSLRKPQYMKEYGKRLHEKNKGNYNTYCTICNIWMTKLYSYKHKNTLKHRYYMNLFNND